MDSHVRPSILLLTLLLLLFANLFASPCNAALPFLQGGIPATSLEDLKFQAEAGDANAQYKLALGYLSRNPTAPDYTEAIKWFRASAAHGNSHAQFFLGYLYQWLKG